MKSLYIFVVYMLVAVSFPVAYGQSVSKEKKISGRFSAGRGKLVIDNRYGKLDINTWDKNEVTVDITITAKAMSASDAQKILDRVSITKPEDKGNNIYYKTVIAKEKISITKSEFSIKYVINMPFRHTAAFINKYGDIEISDVDGKLDIDLEYGHLKTAAIRGNDNDIKVGFGSATIASIETGNIRSSYSRLSIKKAGSIKVFNQSEKTDIGTVRDLDIDQKYGDLKIGSINQLKGAIQYAGISVDKLLKSAQITLSHCSGGNFNYVGPDANNIDVNSSFSNLYFHFDKAAGLSGNIVVSFGNVKSDISNISLTGSGSNKLGDKAAYKMKIGSGRGNIALTLSYGNVIFK